jgi:hypothetical protein
MDGSGILTTSRTQTDRLAGCFIDVLDANPARASMRATT